MISNYNISIKLLIAFYSIYLKIGKSCCVVFSAFWLFNFLLYFLIQTKVSNENLRCLNNSLWLEYDYWFVNYYNLFQHHDLVQAGIANETSDPIVLRSGVNLKEFNNETVLRAAAQTSIQDCLCQCHWQTFRDRYGRTHGNCKR